MSKERIEEMKTVWADGFPNQETTEYESVSYHIDLKSVRTDRKSLGHKLICRSEDRKKMVQLTGTFMTVNHLAQYPGWEGGFKEMILQQTRLVFAHYEFESITRLGLRYIDRINIPQKPLRWQDWFHTYLRLPAEFQNPGAKIQFNFQNQLAPDLRANLKVVSIKSGKEDISSVIFDLDIVSEKCLKLLDMEAELERIHEPQGLAFESLLKDNTRELFEPEDR